MGTLRPAEHHFVRRRPPPEREAGRWIELSDASGRPFWLDTEIWVRPVPVRVPEEIPAPLAPVVAEAARRPVPSADAKPVSLRFLHESLFFELQPAAAGLDAAAFAAAAPAIAEALRRAGCAYAEAVE